MTIAAGLADFHRLDLLAGGDSPLHRLDPRAKLIAILLFVVAALSYPRHAVTQLLPWFALPLGLAVAAGLPVGFLARRALVVLPFAALIGIANPWFDRVPAWSLGPLVVTGGWLSFASILLRALLAAAAGLLLVALTGMPALLAALARLRVPRALVVQLALLYRYLALLGDEWRAVAAARALRANGHRLGLREYAQLAGSLLLRCAARAERIYAAMRSRGFDGTFAGGAALRLRAADALFVAAMAALVAALRFGDAAGVLGALLTGVAR